MYHGNFSPLAGVEAVHEEAKSDGAPKSTTQKERFLKI